MAWLALKASSRRLKKASSAETSQAALVRVCAAPREPILKLAS